MKFLKFLTKFFYVLMIIFFSGMFIVTGYFLVILALWGIFGVISEIKVIHSFFLWSVVLSGTFLAVLACNMVDEMYAKKFREEIKERGREEEREETEG